MAIFTVELRKTDRFQFVAVEADGWESAVDEAERRYKEGPLSDDGVNVMYEKEAMVTDDRGCVVVFRKY